MLQFVNLSTGKVTQKISLVPPKSALSLPKNLSFTLSVNAVAFSDAGDLLFVGDSKGYIHTFTYDLKSSSAQLVGKILASASSRSVTSIEFKAWFTSQEQSHPSLLVNCCDSSVKIFK